MSQSSGKVFTTFPAVLHFSSYTSAFYVLHQKLHYLYLKFFFNCRYQLPTFNVAIQSFLYFMEIVFLIEVFYQKNVAQLEK